jgi:pimeloyl-ACP methyl ester carboxylesterase
VARLTPEERARLDPFVARLASGDDDPEVNEQITRILWPSYNHDHSIPTPAELPRIERPTDHQQSTLASIADHYERGTLVSGLPAYAGPALLLHGDDDPLPASASADTAGLIPRARLEVIDGCGHFPWIERPGAVREAVTAWLAEVG